MTGGIPIVFGMTAKVLYQQLFYGSGSTAVEIAADDPNVLIPLFLETIKGIP